MTRPTTRWSRAVFRVCAFMKMRAGSYASFAAQIARDMDMKSVFSGRQGRKGCFQSRSFSFRGRYGFANDVVGSKHCDSGHALLYFRVQFYSVLLTDSSLRVTS
jgi:hypothetical protein